MGVSETATAGSVHVVEVVLNELLDGKTVKIATSKLKDVVSRLLVFIS
jgi:hypothetical protein